MMEEEWNLLFQSASVHFYFSIHTIKNSFLCSNIFDSGANLWTSFSQGPLGALLLFPGIETPRSRKKLKFFWSFLLDHFFLKCPNTDLPPPSHQWTLNVRESIQQQRIVFLLQQVVWLKWSFSAFFSECVVASSSVDMIQNILDPVQLWSAFSPTQRDQVGRFIAVLGDFQKPVSTILSPNCPHFWATFEKLSKSNISQVKVFLATFLLDVFFYWSD